MLAIEFVMLSIVHHRIRNDKQSFEIVVQAVAHATAESHENVPTDADAASLASKAELAFRSRQSWQLNLGTSRGSMGVPKL